MIFDRNNLFDCALDMRPRRTHGFLHDHPEPPAVTPFPRVPNQDICYLAILESVHRVSDVLVAKIDKIVVNFDVERVASRAQIIRL